jgi:hypothetical protein
MKGMRRMSMVLALGAATTLAGCGGVSFALPGTSASLGLGSPGQTLRLGPSGCLLTGGAYGHRVGMNAAAVAGERMQMVQRQAAKFSLASSDVRAIRAGWQSIAAGGC